MLKLISPNGDKNWAVEGHLNKEQHDKLLGLFTHHIPRSIRSVVPKTASLYATFRHAQPFFQGGSLFQSDPQWIMVEFWTDDQSAILSSAEAMSEFLGIELTS